MSAGPSRSRDARALAEIAYADLLQAVGSNRSHLVLIGGLVPEHLVESDEPHQGTNDVDVLLDIGLVYDRDDLDFGWLEEALYSAGFVTATPNTGWRWVKDVHGFPVVVEFLVDVQDSAEQEIALPGAATLGAKNVRGPSPALRDIRHAVVGGQAAAVAGLGGYLAAKGASAYYRRADKDLYDFAWVLVADLRAGSGNAATEVMRVIDPSAERDRADAILSVCHLFDAPAADGPRVFAELSQAAGADESRESLALDAVVAVAHFKAAFADELARARSGTSDPDGRSA